MTREELGRRIAERATLRGDFLLRSGARSNIYFDKYLFESDPELLRRIAECMAPMVSPQTQALAGLEMGGIPLATMLSQITGLPALFVRKRAKEYGTRRLAEGGPVAGQRLTIVEDVVTSGGQIILSAKELREQGAEIAGILCVIDREAGGHQQLAAAGLTLRALFTLSELQPANA